MNSDNLIIRPKKPKGEDGNKVFSIRVKEEIVFQIIYLLKQAGTEMN